MNRRVSINLLVSVIATVGSLALFALLQLVPDRTLADWAIRAYSGDGALTAEGNGILARAVGAARTAFLLLVPAGALLTLVIWSAERRAREATPSPAPVAPLPFTSAFADSRWRLLSLMAIGLAAASVHLTDSFYNDELDTIVLVAPRLSTVFGIGISAAENVPGNHILMSLLTHVMVGLGFRSEPALRLWSLAAFLGTIPVAFWLARLLDMPRWQATIAAALVATSPSLLLVGVAVRGYAITAFCGTTALACHVHWLRDPSRRNSLTCAGFIAAGLVANILTLPLSVSVASHVLYLPFDRRGLRSWRVVNDYTRHLTAIFGAIGVGLLAYAVLLPHLFYGSVIYEGLSTRQWTPVALGRLLGDPLLLGNSNAGARAGALVVAALALGGWRYRRRSPAERSGSLAVMMVVVAGLLAYIAPGQTATRVSFYLAPPMLVLMALELFDLRAWPVQVAKPSIAVAVTAMVCAVGVAVSVGRPASGRMRELARRCLEHTGNEPIWTSSSDAKTLAFLQFYLPNLRRSTPTDDGLPGRRSYYLKLEERAHADDSTLSIIERRCRLIMQFDGEANEALYECPPLRDPA